MRRRRRGVKLEMTSLMDVMFLVLVFFIYSVFNMSVHKGMKVELPDAAGETESGERIVITIRPDDTMELNGVEHTQAEIVERVRELASLKMKLPVLISGDRRSSLGVGVALLGELRSAGIENVRVQVTH